MNLNIDGPRMQLTAIIVTSSRSVKLLIGISFQPTAPSQIQSIAITSQRLVLAMFGAGKISAIPISYFPESHPARGACTSPDLALLSTPGTKTGDGPPDKGKIGTIQGSKYPELSLWAIYDLIELRLTPLVPEIYYDKLITVEVFGWRENGTETTTIRTKIKGSEVGYKVEFPKGEWNAIVQWQVRVWWSAGTRQTRENFGFLIDDMVRVNPRAEPRGFADERGIGYR
ncbi:hypothetical protein Q9L58_000986 [Maublancomyces gigas]|uniref:Uncharacterized protein n=1 Tax=Discina gigas TaxID=1032678 RepID=A0ABR3GVS3_9PEZI